MPDPSPERRVDPISAERWIQELRLARPFDEAWCHRLLMSALEPRSFRELDLMWFSPNDLILTVMAGDAASWRVLEARVEDGELSITEASG